MKVIIVGAGAIGAHLADLFSKIKQDIVIIDDDEEKLERIQADSDLMTIQASTNTPIKALKDAGVKREILYGVSVAGLTEYEDYTGGNVTWENGGDSGWLRSFPCMVAPGSVYHLSRWGKYESSRYADYNWQDEHTVNKVTEGYLKVVPVAFSPSPPATVWLLRGDASVSPLPADDFFARRSPLHQSALSLVPPSGLPAFARDTGQKQPSPSQELLLADFWFAHGDFRRAADSYASLLDASPDDDPAFSPLSALLGRADSLVNLRQFSQAIPLYRQALERDPQNPRILNNLAYALMLENKNAFEALSFANRARELDPSNPLVLETVGSLNLRIGDYETAARTLELAWARALKHPPEVQITIMDQLVRAWLGCGRPHLAYQVAEHRRRTFPDSNLPPDILAQFPSLRHPPPPPTPLPLHP